MPCGLTIVFIVRLYLRFLSNCLIDYEVLYISIQLIDETITDNSRSVQSGTATKAHVTVLRATEQDPYY